MIVRRLSQTVVALCVVVSMQLTSVQAQPSITDSMNSIFSLAESKLGEYFPAGSETQFFQSYVYRYYDSTSTYLAFADDDVLLLGGIFGNSILNVGSILSVEGLLESYQVPAVSDELWNLSISGVVHFFGEAIDFSDIVLEGVPAPDVTNVAAISEFMNSNLNDLPVDENALSVIIISNTDSQRIIDVSFTLTVDSISAGYDLRMTFTR